MIGVNINGVKREFAYGSVGINGKVGRIKKVIIGKADGNHLVWEYYIYPIKEDVDYSNTFNSGQEFSL